MRFHLPTSPPPTPACTRCTNKVCRFRLISLVHHVHHRRFGQRAHDPLSSWWWLQNSRSKYAQLLLCMDGMEPRVTESVTDQSELVLCINTVIMNHAAKGRFFMDCAIRLGQLKKCQIMSANTCQKVGHRPSDHVHKRRKTTRPYVTEICETKTVVSVIYRGDNGNVMWTVLFILNHLWRLHVLKIVESQNMNVNVGTGNLL